MMEQRHEGHLMYENTTSQYKNLETVILDIDVLILTCSILIH